MTKYTVFAAFGPDGKFLKSGKYQTLSNCSRKAALVGVPVDAMISEICACFLVVEADAAVRTTRELYKRAPPKATKPPPRVVKSKKETVVRRAKVNFE
jgi:hypothetical protein